jgi:hypothetical protein
MERCVECSSKKEDKYLQCKKIDTAISRAKEALTKKAKKNGIYENFGQKEVREIKDKFIDISDYSPDMNMNRDKLKNFDNWCMNYTGR